MKKQDVGTYAEQFGDNFQRHILAVALRIPGFVVRYRSALQHTYFTSDVHRVVAKELFKHTDEYRFLPSEPTLVETIRPVVDEAAMEQIEETVAKLYQESVTDADAVKDKVVEFGKTQAAINAVLESAEDLEKGDRSHILERIQESLLVGEDILDIGTDYLNTMPERDQWYSLDNHDDREVIPTGIYHLDMALGGGLGRGELGVVLAPPKRGKTTVLINFGFGAMMSTLGFNVVHYSHEIVEERQYKVSRRYDDRLAGKFVKLKYQDPAKYAQIVQDRAGKFLNGRLFVKSYPTRTASVSTLRNHLTLLISRGFKPDLIIADYADIMKPDRRLGEMRHEQAGIYEALRGLAGEFDAALWTGSQTPRGALEKEVITLGDFAEAFEKAAIVDAAVGLCQTEDEKLASRCRLFLCGLRHEEDGRTVECLIRRDRALLKSTALLDVGYAVIDQDEQDPLVETMTTTVQAGDTEHAAETLKKTAGIKKAKKKKYKKAGKKAPGKKAPKRKRAKKPSKTLDLDGKNK